MQKRKVLQIIWSWYVKNSIQSNSKPLISTIETNSTPCPMEYSSWLALVKNDFNPFLKDWRGVTDMPSSGRPFQIWSYLLCVNLVFMAVSGFHIITTWSLILHGTYTSSSSLNLNDQIIWIMFGVQSQVYGSTWQELFLFQEGGYDLSCEWQRMYKISDCCSIMCWLGFIVCLPVCLSPYLFINCWSVICFW